MEKLDEKRPLGTPIHMLGDNIKVDLKEARWGSMDWIHLAQDRIKFHGLVNMVINLWVHKMW
jgi:hypothetical protein